MENKKNKNQGKLIAIFVIIAVIALALAIILFDPFLWRENKTTNNQESETVETITPSPVVDSDASLVKELWTENSALSSDYIGTIKFESGIIDLPFVQGTSNDTYYRTDWLTKSYDEEGTVYMDSANTLDDQNIILIGHYVYEVLDASRTHKFTPLAKLLDKANYEDNKYVKLYLENEVRRYEIAYVYYCELISEEYNGETFQYTENGYEFYIPNYTESEFNTYINTVKAQSLYDTGISIDYSDKFLTLQTCVENHDELREIVLLKEIERTSYE